MQTIQLNAAYIARHTDFTNAAVAAALEDTNSEGQRRWSTDAQVTKITGIGDEHVQVTIADDSDDDETYDIQKSDTTVTIGIDPLNRPDIRYTTAALKAYDEDQLARHLAERTAQLERSKRFRDEEHAILDAADPETETYRRTLNNISQLTREHAEQRAIISRIKRAIAEREDAVSTHPRLDLVDAAITTEHGMPCTLEEANDVPLARLLWERIVTGAETFGDEAITVTEAAHRVADIYGRIWNPPTVTLDLDGDDAQLLAEYLRDAADGAARENRNGDWTIRVVRSLDEQTGR